MTARRREESFLDIPFSLTVIEQEELRSRLVTSLVELDGAIPNVNFDSGTFATASSATPTFFIRGIGQDDYLPTTDPGVGVYLDGVYTGRTVGQNLSSVDIAQIEILRGPQGALYGRNTIGGAINVSFRRPSFESSLVTKMTLGTSALTDISLRTDLPLSEDLRSAFTFSLSRKNGFSRSPNEPKIDFGDTNRFLIRGQVEFDLNEDFSIYISADWSRQREESEPSFAYGSDFGNPNTLVALFNSLTPLLDRRPITIGGLTPITDPSNISLTGPSRDDLDVWGIQVTADWKLSEALELKSITAIRGLNGHIENDQDSLAPLAATFDAKFRQKQISQEFQFSSKIGELDLVGGLYVFAEDARDDTDLLIIPGLFGVLESLPGPVIPLAPIPIDPQGSPRFDCTNAPIGFPCAGGLRNPINAVLDQTIRLFGDVGVRNLAAYIHGSLVLNSELTLSVGGRLTHERKTFFGFQSKVESSAALGQTIFNLTPRTDREAWTRFTPTMSLAVKPSDSSMIYVTYSRGFRSGAFNGRANSELTFSNVSPEDVDSLEVGARSSFANGRGQLSISSFYNRYDDFQARAVIPSASGLDAFFVNAARAEMMGVEVEASYRHLNGISLGATFGFLDTSLQRVDPFIAQSTGIQAGNDLPMAPKYNGSMYAEYGNDMRLGRFTIRADVNWRSKIFHDAANTDIRGVGTTIEDGYAIVTSRIGFESEDGQWGASLFAKNLTNRVRFSSLVLNAGGLLVAYPQRGREAGISVWHSF